MFRDDQEAMLARLEALDARAQLHEAELADRDAKLAARDARIAELEAENAKLRSVVLDQEHAVLDAKRRRNVDSKPIESKSFPVGSAEARAEADRLLAEGVERHRTGDKQGATACFERGLSLVPDHPQLHRALRRYT